MTVVRLRCYVLIFIFVCFSFAGPHQALAENDSSSSGFDLEVTTSISPNKETFSLEIKNVESHPVFCERIVLQSVRAKSFAGNCGFVQETVDIVFRDVVMSPKGSFTRNEEGLTQDRFYCHLQRPLYTRCSKECGPDHGLVSGKCHKYCRADGRNYLLDGSHTPINNVCEKVICTCSANGEWDCIDISTKPGPGQFCP